MEEETPMKVFMDAGLTGKEEIPEDVPVVNATFLDTDGNLVKIGAGGQQGPQGDPGTPAGFGNITATVDSTTGTPQVSVQADGPNTAKNISFSFTGLKGEKGEKGEAGTEVNSIAPLTVEEAPTSVNDHSLAAGGEAAANGDYSVAIGNTAETRTEATYSVAIGHGASSRADNSIAIGNESIATEEKTVSFGNPNDLPYAPATRRLVNVTDPVNAQDAATKNYVDTKIADIPSGTDINVIAPLHVNTAPSIFGDSTIAIGNNASVTASGSVAIGNGSLANATNTFSVGRLYDTRRITNVTDPTDPQDAATKNYVDTQLTPINAKLQYVPENTNQILSQIQTNVEKAQAAAEAAQTTADGTQSALTTLQNTVAQLQETVTQLQATTN